jgi:hypothetical protein
MPKRLSQTPAAIRGRAYRKRKADGIGDFRIRNVERLLAKVLILIAYAEGRPPIPDPPTHAEIEVELNLLVDALLTYWLGPSRKK